MSGELRFRLGELLESPARCGFLDDEETMRLVDGRLSAPRLEAFERHAPDCPTCRELADDLQMFRNLTTSGVTVPTEIKAFAETDGAVRRRLERLSFGRRLRRLLYWLSPALATVALVVFLWPQPRLIAKIEPVPIVPPPAVRSLDRSRAWQQIAETHQAGDLASTAELLETAVAEAPHDADLLFYLGQTRLLQGDAAAAVDMLERADEIQRAASSEHTRWMLAAALERTDRVDEACAALRSVVEIGATRASAAREIVARRCGSVDGDQSAP